MRGTGDVRKAREKDRQENRRLNAIYGKSVIENPLIQLVSLNHAPPSNSLTHQNPELPDSIILLLPESLMSCSSQQICFDED